jgi:hypothetical protein
MSSSKDYENFLLFRSPSREGGAKLDFQRKLTCSFPNSQSRSKANPYGDFAVSGKPKQYKWPVVRR